MNTDEAPPELVAAEASNELGVDRSTLVRWVQSGKLVPSRKLPGRTGAYLFRRADVDALKSTQAVPA